MCCSEPEDVDPIVIRRLAGLIITGEAMTVTSKNLEYSGEYVDSMTEQEVHRRREWITEWFGERCEEFESTCVVCQMWKNQDQFERVAIGT